MNIFINPGHAPNGNPDPGAVNGTTGLRECDVALAVGNLAAKYLIAAGVSVTNVFQCDDLGEICTQANTSGADLFISIHCHSYNEPGPSGTEPWACAGSDRGGKLAGCIQKQIVDTLGTINRGVKIATPGVNGLYVLTNTDAPAVLVELAFISNSGDEKLLATRQDEFARAIARGVTDFQILSM